MRSAISLQQQRRTHTRQSIVQAPHKNEKPAECQGTNLPRQREVEEWDSPHLRKLDNGADHDDEHVAVFVPFGNGRWSGGCWVLLIIRHQEEEPAQYVQRGLYSTAPVRKKPRDPVRVQPNPALGPSRVPLI